MKFDSELIKELMEAMELHQIKRLFLKKEECELELEKAGIESAVLPVSTAFAPQTFAQPVQTAPHQAAVPTENETTLSVTSPFVGTFYSAPSPQDSPYVQEGDQIDEESVVCIVEAMKVMNEVKSGVKGRVKKVLCKNGDPVEFGSEILIVEPT